MKIKWLIKRLSLKRAAGKNPDLNRLLIYRNIDNFYSYCQKNKNVVTADQISCRDCGSESIKEWGLTRRNDNKRVYSCNCCGRILYRRVFSYHVKAESEVQYEQVKQATAR
ncbi:hypothetical protein [Gayadomonas joobiniege]|uniref:hypothetical protein n=1 Tax=Gayadomonas joobiniege TaxID=1234606 RepID=UPI00035C0C82|nr:hypothetical protein [Gayadomonas joobiniege]